MRHIELQRREQSAIGHVYGIGAGGHHGRAVGDGEWLVWRGQLHVVEWL